MNSGCRQICIVTPDLAGPVRNGGIGTHCYWLARALAADERLRVSILFTGPYEQGDKAEVSRTYAALGIHFFDLSDTPAPSFPEYGREWFIEHSLRVMHFLRSRHFDLVHFQDWKANGFHSLRARRTGLAFHDTLFTCTMHSPSEWVREGMQEWPELPVQDAILDYCERYCAEHVDLLISPSRYMFDWAVSHGWKLAAWRKVIPNCLGECPIGMPAPAADYRHIAFFGRLETRKGLELFCRAVEQQLDAPDHGALRKVTFLGKAGSTEDGRGALARIEDLRVLASAAGVEVTCLTGLGHQEAWDYLRETAAVVCVCSRQDNYPYTVLEAMLSGLPLLAAGVGGVPEMMEGAALFDPTQNGLLSALQSRSSRAGSYRRLYSPKLASDQWRAVQDEMPVPLPRAAREPLVSVCIPHFNYGRFLPQLLDSLAVSRWKNFEVLVMDDGSTDAHSIESFSRQEEHFAGRGWRFMRSQNAGIGAARNRAAREARGEYLIFMDADNLAAPSMISDFVRGMEVSGVDCLTCHFEAFEGEKIPEPFKPLYGVVPAGACLEAGVVGNVYGDANFCVRKKVFEALGGFGEERGTSYEDWEFLTRLTLAGYRLDVLPAALFYYRHQEQGFSRVTSQLANHQRVLQAFRRCDGDTAHRLLLKLTVPLAKQIDRYVQHASDQGAVIQDLRGHIAGLELQLKRKSYRALGWLHRCLDKLPVLKAFLGVALLPLWHLAGALRNLTKGRPSGSLAD